MRNPLIVANWKMNGSLEAIDQWVKEFTTFNPLLTEMVICPPFVYLNDFRTRLLTNALDISVGAQNCSTEEMGAFTGEVSAGMLSDTGCQWVILGHSERRMLYGETNEIVAKKAVQAVNVGLKPIVCVGETLEQREAGKTTEVVLSQLNSILDAIGAQELSKGALAYEPVWAIGTGKTATPDQAQAVHEALRVGVESRDSLAASALRILYGGSVKPSNAAKLFACADIDGGLIGGASLKASDFYAIAQASVVPDVIS